MESAHRLIPYDKSFEPLIGMARIKGCDTAACPNSARFIGYGPTHDCVDQPICIVDLVETPYVAEPHVIWLPWISARDRHIAFKWAMRYYGKDKQVLLIVGKKDNALHEHFVKRNFLRKIGVIDNLPEEAGEEIHMYQYKG